MNPTHLLWAARVVYPGPEKQPRPSATTEPEIRVVRDLRGIIYSALRQKSGSETDSYFISSSCKAKPFLMPPGGLQ